MLATHSYMERVLSARAADKCKQEWQLAIETKGPAAMIVPVVMESFDWDVVAKGGGSVLQNSFASTDAMHMMLFRDVVDKKVAGWTMCELLTPGINDRSWLREWKEQLDRSDGCLVLFTRSYRDKVSVAQSPVRMEAEAIKARLDEDSTFKLFVLDPDADAQVCAPCIPCTLCPVPPCTAHTHVTCTCTCTTCTCTCTHTPHQCPRTRTGPK